VPRSFNMKTKQYTSIWSTVGVWHRTYDACY